MQSHFYWTMQNSVRAAHGSQRDIVNIVNNYQVCLLICLVLMYLFHSWFSAKLEFP